MPIWKLTTAAALATCMIAAPALAQQTTGDPAKGMDKSTSEMPKGAATDTMKPGDMKSGDMKSETMKSDDMKSTDMKADKKAGAMHRKGAMTAMGDEKVKAAQQALKDKGHDPGAMDGKMGPKTQAAIRDFQKAQGMEATGHLDAKTMQALGMEGDKTSSTGASSTAGSASPSTSTDMSKTDASKSDTTPKTDTMKTDAPKTGAKK